MCQVRQIRTSQIRSTKPRMNRSRRAILRPRHPSRARESGRRNSRRKSPTVRSRADAADCSRGMLRIGAHMSVAGGVALAVERAVVHGCEALQIFARNPNRWRSPPLDADDVRRFRTRLDETGITPAVSHASYLINLATALAPLRALSIAALIDELDRAHTLGLAGVVLHPGAWTSGTEREALALVAAGLDEVLA